MKIVVINLEHAVERRDRVAAALDGLGLAFELFPAVDGQHLSPGQEALIDYDALHRQGWPMRAGALGNWLSHRAILADMIDNGPEAMAILEDDIEPAPELPAVLDALERSAGSYDIVFLNRGRAVRRFVPHRRLDTGHRLGWLRWSHFGTQGYVITRPAARRFLETFPRVRMNIDRSLAAFWRTGLATYCVRPPAVRHLLADDGNDSMIQATDAVGPADPLFRLRRRWFFLREGVAKRAALTRLAVRALGPAQGLGALLGPRKGCYDAPTDIRGARR